jgi:chromosome segregation ATPase
VNTTSLHLTKLDLTAFRGIEQLSGFQFGKRLTIIYGGNATGKSSIAQAIEFAISGQVRDQEDGLIPAAYLANTRAQLAGLVSLTLDNGDKLTAATDEPRLSIEQRFRSVGMVDWPERQPLPFTTTHLTTQGMLAGVLGSANPVTRNDLSGLCAGAYLRALVSRAQKLTDHFRQASSGRNIQAELRDARDNYDTAKLLVDSMLVTNRITESSESVVELKILELNSKLSLPEPTSLAVALAHLGKRYDAIEHQLQVIQGLLSRTRELGQYESELSQLKSQANEKRTAEQGFEERRSLENTAFSGSVEKLKLLATERANLLNVVADYERHQQSISTIAALDERLRDLRANRQRVTEDLQSLTKELEVARRDFAHRSEKLAQLRQSRQVAEVQRTFIQQAISGIMALPSEQDPELVNSLVVLKQDLADRQRTSEILSVELRRALDEEFLFKSRLSETSQVGERLLAARNEIRSFLVDSRCPLCGYDHGSVQALEKSIEQITETAFHGTSELRQQFETSSKHRQGIEANQLELTEQMNDLRHRIASIVVTIEKRTMDRRGLVTSLAQTMRRTGLSLPLEADALRRGHVEVDAKIAGLDQEIRDVSAGESEDADRYARLERTIAAKSSEYEQVDRVAAELTAQIAKIRATLGAGTPAEEIEKKKVRILELAPLIRSFEHEQGQIQARLNDLDRNIAERRSELSGIDRRLGVVQTFLESLDSELMAIGATRDLRTVLDIDQRSRHERDQLLALKTKATEIQQDLRNLEESRAVVLAQQQLRTAENKLKSVQNRQQRFEKRGTQFKDLYESLEGLQNDTAEIVLENIHKPVGTIFQAMTAGCPWDIEFKLDDGRLSAFLTDGSANGLEARSVLNSAYVNVAAIALRLALASQQRWTQLKTIVLDDPILEMDQLTQSALIDGLEAVLSSSFSPWEDLQFVLTTWSEDFAVMAAHKLAHLNDAKTVRESAPDNFIIHRLSMDLEGKVVSRQHVPRWRVEASAA